MSPKRRQHLLNGRRVQVRDLLKAGLLAPDAKIVFRRPIAGDDEEAALDAHGHIVLRDGRSFKTLSGAAFGITGTSIDGWSSWTTTDGQPLSALREHLLANDAAEESDSGIDHDQLRMSRHAYLAEATRQAVVSPVSTPVRELLGLWGFTTESGENARTVEADLANYGLESQPRLFVAPIDGLVNLVKVVGDLKLDADQCPVAADPLDDDLSDAAAVDGVIHSATTVVTRLTIGTLPSACSGLESINPNSSIQEAITRMSINDFSQLPVMSSSRVLVGAVSRRSIARARNVDPNASLRDATFMPYSYSVDDDLIPRLPMLAEHDFFLVRKPNNEYAGIVTSIDVVSAYQQLASPYLMLGEIDQRLRRIVEINFDNDTIIDVCDSNGSRRITSISQLTIGDYKQLLDHADRWAELGWSLDRRIFCDRLEEIRALRNEIMHFNRGTTDLELQANQLRHFTDLLREYEAYED